MGIGLVKAREMAGDLHAEVKLGQDPAAQKAEAKDQAADTSDVTADRFLKVKEGKISANYHGEMTRHLKEDAKPLHGLPVRMVKRRIVASLLSDLRESRSEKHGRSCAFITVHLLHMGAERRTDGRRRGKPGHLHAQGKSSNVC